MYLSETGRNFDDNALSRRGKAVRNSDDGPDEGVLEEPAAVLVWLRAALGAVCCGLHIACGTAHTVNQCVCFDARSSTLTLAARKP